MTYTIKGKQYTEFDINKRCAELMAHEVVNYCRSAHYAWTIINKCWNELMLDAYYDESKTVNDIGLVSTKWEYLMHVHNCTKLTAACICLIEMQEGT
jgi:hypothetical protein